MSNPAFKVLAGSGAGDNPVYVDDVFSTDLWTGNGGTQSIVNGVDLSGEGGLVWIKNREQTYSHYLTDTERGATKQLSSDSNGSEVTSSARITAFNNNGFTLGGNAATNGNTRGIVGWTFRKQEKFFDIVTYTGNGTAGRTISHNLNSVPGMIIVKRTSATENWNSYHRAIDSSSPENYFIDLDRVAARDTLTGACNCSGAAVLYHLQNKR